MLKLKLRVSDKVFNWLHAEAVRLNIDVSGVVRRVLRNERRDLAAVRKARKGKQGRTRGV